jgi:hypothetical protein
VAATRPAGDPVLKNLPIVAAPMPTNVYWHSETWPAYPMSTTSDSITIATTSPELALNSCDGDSTDVATPAMATKAIAHRTEPAKPGTRGVRAPTNRPTRRRVCGSRTMTANRNTVGRTGKSSGSTPPTPRMPVPKSYREP